MSHDTQIARLMREKGITQQALADRLGVTRQAVALWQKSGRFSSSTLPKVAAALGVSPGVLLGDAAEEDDPHVVRVVSDAPLRPGFVRVPVFDAAGSCGMQNGQVGGDLITGALDLSERFVRSLAGVTSTRRLQVISSTGDSMSPTIESRALILLDTNQRQVIGDGVFCLRIEGELFIKRLQRVPGGGVTLLSDNPRYPAQTLTREAFAEADVLGRVVYAFNGQMI
jgi:phage repressor protein C with HTH and peptisase S24 domain